MRSTKVVSEPSPKQGLLNSEEEIMPDLDQQAVSRVEMRELLESMSRTFDKRCAEITSIMKRQLDYMTGKMECISLKDGSPGKSPAQ